MGKRTLGRGLRRWRVFFLICSALGFGIWWWVRLRVPSTPILFDVPVVLQSTSFTCGPAALLSILGYYGHDLNEVDLARALATTPEYGTRIDLMADFANRLGIRAEIRHDVSLSDLADALKRRQPAIVEAQAWLDHETTEYQDLWDDGHYMVVIGMDRDKVYFIDPSLLGGRGFIPADEFLLRWHDISVGDQRLHRTAIFFDGTPKPPPRWQRIR